MIIKTTKFVNNVWYDYTYSDLSVMIKKPSSDVMYVDALDPLSSNVDYIETNIQIPDETQDFDEL